MTQSATPSVSNGPININVGGILYSSDLETLTKFPGSKLAQMFDGSQPTAFNPDKNNEYFINRDGGSFRHILNFLRMGKVVLPKNYDEIDLLLEEAKFYGIEDLSKALRETQAFVKEANQDLRERNLGKRKTDVEDGNEPLFDREERADDAENISNDDNSYESDEEYYDNGETSSSCFTNAQDSEQDHKFEMVMVECNSAGGVMNVYSSNTNFNVIFPTDSTRHVYDLHICKYVNKPNLLFSYCFYFRGWIRCSMCAVLSEYTYHLGAQYMGCEHCHPVLPNGAVYEIENAVTVGFTWLADYLLNAGFDLKTSWATHKTAMTDEAGDYQFCVSNHVFYKSSQHFF